MSRRIVPCIARVPANGEPQLRPGGLAAVCRPAFHVFPARTKAFSCAAVPMRGTTCACMRACAGEAEGPPAPSEPRGALRSGRPPQQAARARPQRRHGGGDAVRQQAGPQARARRRPHHAVQPAGAAQAGAAAGAAQRRAGECAHVCVRACARACVRMHAQPSLALCAIASLCR